MKTIAKFAVLAVLFAVIAAAGVVSGQSIAASPAVPHPEIAPGLFMPAMDPVRGMHLFASKGCVVCHSINGVGGTDAPKLDATTMAPMMNPFEFFAKMWRGATPMIAMQQHEIGHQIEFTGQDIADIVAFVHNREVQKSFTADVIPADIKKHMEGDEGDKDRGGSMGHGMGGGKNMMGPGAK